MSAPMRIGGGGGGDGGEVGGWTPKSTNSVKPLLLTGIVRVSPCPWASWLYSEIVIVVPSELTDSTKATCPGFPGTTAASQAFGVVAFSLAGALSYHWPPLPQLLGTPTPFVLSFHCV